MDKSKSYIKCSVCGRVLRKSSGPIGPACFKKLQGTRNNSKRIRMKKSSYISISAKYDMYKEEKNGSREDDSSSENS